MNILVEGGNLENYYAKVHISWRKGWEALFNTKCYGEGYPEYDEKIESFVEIKALLFGNEELDLLVLTDCWNATDLSQPLKYKDIDKLSCKKAIILADFWSEAENKREDFFEFVEKYEIDYVFSYFRAPFLLWRDFPISKKLIWFPVCVDPRIFNDWGMEKKYDVGNLNAGIYSLSKFYPERYMMHQKLLEMDIKYLHEKHPGTGILAPDTPLIGKKFSEAIGSCKIFVTSGNLQYKNFPGKFVEIMASGSCLFTNEPMDAEVIGLVDGVNYVSITEENFVEKIKYYLEHEDELERITMNGYHFVHEKYNCYVQPWNVYQQLINHPTWKVEKNEYTII